MKIGILGGTFDPVHLGHLELAQKALIQFSLGKVILVPTYQSPHKQKKTFLNSPQDRCEMVRLAVEGQKGLEVSDCEIQRKGISYSIDTVIELKKKYPGAEFFMILGGDSLEGLDSWQRADELKKWVRFLVAKRENYGGPVPLGARVEWIQMPLCPISASGIRETIRNEKSAEAAVPLKVLRYIQTHSLYRKSER